jgi:hypothetical protein
MKARCASPLVLSGFLLLSVAGSVPAQSGRVPIVIELFTSEGCSSCPPADEFLVRLSKEQPVEGVEIVALGEHVDYWDRLGWRDPYSSAECTARQQRYAQRFRIEGPYTPQMVVDGRLEFVGSDARQAGAAIAHANPEPKATVRLTPRPGGVLEVRVENLPPVSKGDATEVLLAITEDNLSSSVSRGENKGRTLHHTGVVRRLTVLGQATPQHSPAFSAEPVVALEKTWKRENLRAVVLVQERTSLRILGAASAPLGSKLQ